MMRLAPALLVLLIAPACADQGSFPSLAKRPFEKGQAAVPAPVAPTVPSDPALLGRIADALGLARGGVAAFDAALPAAREAAQRASGTAEGSDSWIAGQLMVTRLEQTLEPARDALVLLDDERRYLDQHPGSPDAPALQNAIAEVEAIDARQSASVKTLLDLLR